MKILLSVAVWGSEYVAALAHYSLATLLSPRNIPKLAAEHEVTCHIVTTRKDAQQLQASAAFKELSRHCAIAWDYIEDHGYKSRLIPRGQDWGKYAFMSRLQNLAIAKSLSYDVLILNYADFVWADGSLTSSIRPMLDGMDAVLSFCLPVDSTKGKRAIDASRADGTGGVAVTLPPREAAAIAIDCLHRETRLRFWNGPQFTETPTYLLWAVGDQGVLVRAYHQTVLALRVQHDNRAYTDGIQYGSLDGYFTALLAEHAKLFHVTDSDDVMVFSLFETASNSAIVHDRSREHALRECLRTRISPAQRAFAETPICIKRTSADPAAWQPVVDESWRLLEPIHQSTARDAAAFRDFQVDVMAAEDDWRRAHWARRFYLQIVLRVAAGRLGRVIRRAMGSNRSRSVRLAVERLLLRRKNAGV
jgi:hypothetical protein